MSWGFVDERTENMLACRGIHGRDATRHLEVEAVAPLLLGPGRWGREDGRLACTGWGGGCRGWTLPVRGGGRPSPRGGPRAAPTLLLLLLLLLGHVRVKLLVGMSSIGHHGGDVVASAATATPCVIGGAGGIGVGHVRIGIIPSLCLVLLAAGMGRVVASARGLAGMP